MPGRSSTRALLLLAVPLLGGCQRFERVDDCKKIAALVNPALAAVDDARQKHPGDAATYRDIARRYDTLAAGMWGLKLQTKRLSEAMLEYQKVMREAGHDARQFAEALDAKDQAKINIARVAASRTVKHEAAVIGRLDGTCRGR